MSALGITALVGLLIGVVLSYLSSQQLARYGANVLIVDLLGISILRELGRWRRFWWPGARARR